MTTDIPKARELIMNEIKAIRALANIHGQPPSVQFAMRAIAQNLQDVLPMMTRSVKANPRTISRKITSEVVREILLILHRRGYLTDAEVGAEVGVNAGRVNEVRNGLRTVDNPTMSGDGLNRRMGGE